MTALAAELRRCLSLHQVVTVVGGRGTGKSLALERLATALEASGVTVVKLDAGSAEDQSDLDAPVAEALNSPISRLTAQRLPPDTTVRVLVDACEQLHGKSWLPFWQESWRACLSEAEARGRVAVALAGRPLFRQSFGGRGSPLINLGPTLAPRPLTEEDACRELGVAASVAAAVVRKTGGHPQMTERLALRLGNDLSRMGEVFTSFLADESRYLMRLLQDHAVGGMAVVGVLLDAGGAVDEAALIGDVFGTSRVDAEECLADLAASGLIDRDAGRCWIAAEMIVQSAAARQVARVPSAFSADALSAHFATAAEMIYQLENALRQLIAEALGEVTAAWWQTRVLDHLVGQAESRRRAELDSAVDTDRNWHPIMYLSIGELFEIIQSQPNFDEVFRLRLRRGLPVVANAAADIRAVRNKVAHSRAVSSRDVEILIESATRLGFRDTVTADVT